jgi:CubicO group peptidase (beta-lactamase class C family)
MAGPPPTPLRDRTFSLGTIEALGEASARAHRAAEIPAGNGHGTAMSIARAFGGMARGGELDGVRLVPESQVAMMHEEQVRGTDEVLGMESRYGLGFWLPAGMLTPHRGPRCFHHPGVGGALGLADPDLKLGIGYAMNRTGAAVRRMPLERAIYAALGV